VSRERVLGSRIGTVATPGRLVRRGRQTATPADNWSDCEHHAYKVPNVRTHLQSRNGAATPHGVQLDCISVFDWRSELHNNKLPCSAWLAYMMLRACQSDGQQVSQHCNPWRDEIDSKSPKARGARTLVIWGIASRGPAASAPAPRGHHASTPDTPPPWGRGEPISSWGS